MSEQSAEEAQASAVGGGGVAAVSARALGCALASDSEMLAAEMGWLDVGQLRQLIGAAQLLHDSAQAELNGRPVR